MCSHFVLRHDDEPLPVTISLDYAIEFTKSLGYGFNIQTQKKTRAGLVDHPILIHLWMPNFDTTPQPSG